MYLLQVKPIGLSIVQFLIAASIFMMIFLLIRGIMLWYWRVDTIIKNQEETIRQLQAINNKLENTNRKNDII